MTGHEMIKLLKKHGWYIDRIHGSHYVLKRDGKIVVVPVHSGKDLPKGLENSLRKQIEKKI